MRVLPVVKTWVPIATPKTSHFVTVSFFATVHSLLGSIMPPTMKGTPFASSATARWTPGGFDHTPMPPFNKFSADGGGGSAWTVSDGTLGTFCPHQSVVNDRWFSSMRDLGKYGVGSKPTAKNPSWKTAVEKTMPLQRVPKRSRLGISGMELGPTFVE